MLYMFIRSRLMHEHVVRKRFLHEFTNIIHTLTVVQLCLHSGIVIHMLMQLPCRLSVQWQGYGVHDGVPPTVPTCDTKVPYKLLVHLPNQGSSATSTRRHLSPCAHCCTAESPGYAGCPAPACLTIRSSHSPGRWW